MVWTGESLVLSLTNIWSSMANTKVRQLQKPVTQPQDR